MRALSRAQALTENGKLAALTSFGVSAALRSCSSALSTPYRPRWFTKISFWYMLSKPGGYADFYVSSRKLQAILRPALS